MPPYNISGYMGHELPITTQEILNIFTRHGFEVKSSGSANKTIRIQFHGIRCGYINDTVLRSDSVLGYCFNWHGKTSNSCPPESAENIIEIFTKRYQCDSNQIMIHHGAGTNKGNIYLHIKEPTLALRVLIQDIGGNFDDDIIITFREKQYTEGAVRDVTMKAYERSSSARIACLNHYGYNCMSCGINIKSIYRGLPVEIIHVHHERPLAQNNGERVIDPINELKPVCPNCHAVIHSRGKPYSIQEIRNMINEET